MGDEDDAQFGCLPSDGRLFSVISSSHHEEESVQIVEIRMTNQNMAHPQQPIDKVRRRIIKWSFFTGLSFLTPIKAFSSIPDFGARERSISLYNPTTHETLTTVYWANGHYLSDSLADINHIMRDHRTNQVKPIDRGLLNVMNDIRRKLNYDKPFHVISGYRSRKTNDLLRRRGRKAARNSFHLTGEAADIRLPGCRLSALRSAALETKGGGVGYNPAENFVHIDVGPIRYWSYRRKKSRQK